MEDSVTDKILIRHEQTPAAVFKKQTPDDRKAALYRAPHQETTGKENPGQNAENYCFAFCVMIHFLKSMI